MIQNIFIAILCVIALGAGVWSLRIGTESAEENKDSDKKAEKEEHKK